MVESGLMPNNLQNSYESSLGSDDAYTAGVDSGAYSRESFTYDEGGYGLAQWTYWSRKRDMYDFIKGSGRSIADLGAQLEFMMTEVGDAINQVNAATSPSEAASIWMDAYEKPGVEHLSERQSGAESAFAQFGGSHMKGLDRVPYDSYAAFLHKGEAVLTAKEADVWRKYKSDFLGLNRTQGLAGLVDPMQDKAVQDAMEIYRKYRNGTTTSSTSIADLVKPMYNQAGGLFGSESLNGDSASLSDVVTAINESADKIVEKLTEIASRDKALEPRASGESGRMPQGSPYLEYNQQNSNDMDVRNFLQ